VPELSASGVNAVDRTDLATEFLTQSVQRFIALDAVLPQPSDQAIEHFLATIMAVTDTALGLGKRLDHALEAATQNRRVTLDHRRQQSSSRGKVRTGERVSKSVNKMPDYRKSYAIIRNHTRSSCKRSDRS